jgi:hypothetical protein
MTAMPFIEQLVQSIEERMRELSREVASLEQARSALVSNGSAPPRSERRKPKTGSGRNRGGRTAALTPERAEQILGASDGLATAAVSSEASADHNQVLDLLRRLEAAGRVRRSGQRRGTRWHAITDEDRVRDRAADLASRATGRRRKPARRSA